MARETFSNGLAARSPLDLVLAGYFVRYRSQRRARFVLGVLPCDRREHGNGCEGLHGVLAAKRKRSDARRYRDEDIRAILILIECVKPWTNPRGRIPGARSLWVELWQRRSVLPCRSPTCMADGVSLTVTFWVSVSVAPLSSVTVSTAVYRRPLHGCDGRSHQLDPGWAYEPSFCQHTSG